MKKEELKISVLIIAKNEENKIVECIKSVSWANEIVVIDNASTDKTAKVSKDLGAKVYPFSNGSYKDLRNFGLKKATGKWIFYLDSDERVTLELKNEILSLVNNPNPKNYFFAIPRKNIILGKVMIHGGWWPDYVKRLFYKEKLRGWQGDLHEEPQIEGSFTLLKNPIIHIKHDNLSEMVEKTNKWSEVEARLLFDSNHPKMAWWRFFRIMLTEFWFRGIVKAGFLDGPEGIIYLFYQAWSRFLTYAKLWEMQLKNEK